MSRLGLGTAPLASAFWGNTETTAVATARRAIDAGVTFVDTAPFLRAGRVREPARRAALGGAPGIVLATKVGRLLGTGPAGDLEGPIRLLVDAVRTSLDTSLERLGSTGSTSSTSTIPTTTSTRRSLERTELSSVARRGCDRRCVLGDELGPDGDDLPRAVRLDLCAVAGRYTLLDQSAAL